MQFEGQDPNQYLDAYRNDSPEASSWDQVLQDPTFRKVLTAEGPKAATNWLRDRYALDGDWAVDQTGELVPRQNWLQRNMWWAAPAAILGGIGIASAVAPAAATTAASTLPSTPIGTGMMALPGAVPSGALAAAGPAAVAAPGAAAVAPAAAAPAVPSAVAPAAAAAPAATKSIWDRFAGPILETAVPAATNLIGTAMNVRANERAAQTQADAEREALEWEKQVFAQRQQQLAPTIEAGSQATVKLADLMGMDAPRVQNAQPPSYAAAPSSNTATERPTAATSRQPPAATAPALVPMQAPDGRRLMVPNDKVSDALARGAKRVA